MDILGNVTSILGAMPSTSAIAQNVLLGGATTVVMAGLTSSAGQSAIDPLHLFFKGTTAPAGQPTPSAPVVPTVTASAFASLPPASQQSLLASGVHIV